MTLILWLILYGASGFIVTVILSRINQWYYKRRSIVSSTFAFLSSVLFVLMVGIGVVTSIEKLGGEYVGRFVEQNRPQR